MVSHTNCADALSRTWRVALILNITSFFQEIELSTVIYRLEAQDLMTKKDLLNKCLAVRTAGKILL